jgi:uncharacterized protein YndB with AHSA1/START domain
MAAVTGSRRAVVTLPGDRQILIEREFDAPRELVYKAWTTPELVERWWGGLRGRVTSAEIDLRVGGLWRYAMVANGGFEVAFHGEFSEIAENERIVSTEVFEALPDKPTRTTVTFSEADGVTKLTLLVEHTSKENRDVQMASGMEGGLQESFDKLEDVARSLR